MKEGFFFFFQRVFLSKLFYHFIIFHCFDKFFMPLRENPAKLVCWRQKLPYKCSLLSTREIMDSGPQSYIQALSLFTKDGHYSIILSANFVREQSLWLPDANELRAFLLFSGPRQGFFLFSFPVTFRWANQLWAAIAVGAGEFAASLLGASIFSQVPFLPE